MFTTITALDIYHATHMHSAVCYGPLYVCLVVSVHYKLVLYQNNS